MAADQLGLREVDDELARIAGRLPRVPATIRDTAFGDLVTGVIGVDRFADRIARPVDHAAVMLEELGIAELLAAS